MAIIFEKERKRKKYLLITFFIIVFVSLFLVSIEFFVRRDVHTFEEMSAPRPREINIDIETLERVRDLRPFEGIDFVISAPDREGIAAPERRGRSNPFVHFGQGEESLEAFEISEEESLEIFEEDLQ